jgi:hypothetical protein
VRPGVREQGMSCSGSREAPWDGGAVGWVTVEQLVGMGRMEGSVVGWPGVAVRWVERGMAKDSPGGDVGWSLRP